MAVEFGGPASGFRHFEVFQFINSEIRMNGGDPDFHLNFCLNTWNEVEDRLFNIVVDPCVPHSLKRASAWSALAVGVQMVARQHEQQVREAQRLQQLLEAREGISRTMDLKMQQLRRHRDEMAAQLHSTKAALQQMQHERDMLLKKLRQVDRPAQFTLPSHDIVPGLQAGQPSTVVWPLRAEQRRDTGAIEMHDTLYFQDPMAVPPGGLCLPVHPNSFSSAMQSSVSVPVPPSFPVHMPNQMGLSPLPSVAPAVVTEMEAGVVPCQMHPVQFLPPGQLAVYTPCQFATGVFQGEVTPVWGQRCDDKEETLEMLQGLDLEKGKRHLSQEENLQKSQGIGPLVNTENNSQKEAPQRPQEIVLLGKSGEHSEEKDSERPLGIVSLKDTGDHSQEEGQQEPEGIPLQESGQQSQKDHKTSLVDSGTYSQKDGPERAQDPASSGIIRTCSEDEGPESSQGITPMKTDKRYSWKKAANIGKCVTFEEFTSSYSQRKSSDKAQYVTYLRFRKEAVLESPKTNQPKQEKVMQPQGKKALESNQQMSASYCVPANWCCTQCKAVNFSWRVACFRCKKAYIPVGAKVLNEDN